MRTILQRVSRAEVRVADRVTGRIDRGYLLLVGFTHGDAEEALVWMVDKVLGLRLFADAEGRMNLSLDEVGGALLVVSQFTLYGDARKGRRPSWTAAAPAEVAEPLVDAVVEQLRARGAKVETGRFRAHMLVESVNVGPRTLVLDL